MKRIRQGKILVAIRVPMVTDPGNGGMVDHLGEAKQATSDVLQLLVTEIGKGLLARLQLKQEGLTQLLWGQGLVFGLL
jgi:hypothetical protein